MRFKKLKSFNQFCKLLYLSAEVAEFQYSAFLGLPVSFQGVGGFMSPLMSQAESHSQRFRI